MVNNTIDMDMLDKARAIFREDRYATEATGVELLEVGDHYARCGLVLERQHRNARGAVMGGVFGTMADFAFAVASNTDCLDGGQLQWVTVESTIHYMAQPKGERIEAEARLVRMGRSTCLFEAEVYEPGDTKRLLAHVLVGGTRV